MAIEYIPEHVVPFGHSYRIADFYLPKYNTLLEIDGPCHDKSPGLDHWKDVDAKKKYGLNTIRVKTNNISNLGQILKDTLSEARIDKVVFPGQPLGEMAQRMLSDRVTSSSGCKIDGCWLVFFLSHEASGIMVQPFRVNRGPQVQALNESPKTS